MNLWRSLVTATHLAAATVGIAAGTAYERSQPHPPKAGEVGFTLVDCQGVRCRATPLVYGTDGALHLSKGGP